MGAPQADAGWIGKVGPWPSYHDEGSKASENDFTNRNTRCMIYKLLHLARYLKENGGYPQYGNSRKEWNDDNQWNLENPEYR